MGSLTQHKILKEWWQSMQTVQSMQLDPHCLWSISYSLQYILAQIKIHSGLTSSSPGRSPCRVTKMQEAMFLTWQERRGHVQIALMWKSPQVGCGWVGRDREMREILDLLCSERWVTFFPPHLSWFLFLFCWHAGRNIVGPQVTVLAGIVWCSVLHWSNFRMHHPLPQRTQASDLFILHRIHVKLGGEGGRWWRWGNPLFVLVNAWWGLIQLYWITGSYSLPMLPMPR